MEEKTPPPEIISSCMLGIAALYLKDFVTEL